MRLSRIQNFVIIALVIAAVIQTGKLWLYNNDSHNFFYTVFQNTGKNNIKYSGETYILEPLEIVAGYGNKKFSKFYAQSDETGLYEQGNDAIFEVLTKGEFVKESDLEWNSVLASKCVIFKYAHTVTLDDFEDGFEKNNVFEKYIEFDSIVIYPQMNYGSILRVLFINSQTEKVYECSVSKSKSAQNLYNTLEKAQNDEMKSDNFITYISTKQSGFNIFSDDIFVPQWSEAEYVYPVLKRVNPFEKNGEFSLATLEMYIDQFFDSSTSKWSETDNTGTYLFSDDDIVVKYMTTGLLEYYNYEPIDRSINQSFITSYSAAKSFIEQDTSLKTDVYLADWQINEDEAVYYFNYTVNNMPLIPSDVLSNMTDMKYCIEISVKNNSVKKYRRIAYNYSKDNKTAVADKEFIKALDETITVMYENNSENIVTNVQDIKLGYYMSGRDTLKLKWFTTINGEVHSVDCEK